MKTFKEFLLSEENESGYIGTDKLTQTRKNLTPGESSTTPEQLVDFKKKMESQY